MPTITYALCISVFSEANFSHSNLRLKVDLKNMYKKEMK